MKITITYREGFTVLGIQNRLNPMTADYRTIWQSQVMPRMAEMMQLAMEDGFFSVYFGTSEPPLTDMVAGVNAAAEGKIPDGMVARQVPEGPYALVECKMEEIGRVWAEMFEHWKDPESYTIDFSRPSFEYYPPEIQTGKGLVQILLPLTNKISK